MFDLRPKRAAIPQSFAAIVLFATTATAQIAGLCNTGQTHITASGCTGILVPPSPQGLGTSRDGNWALAYPFPSPLTTGHGPCALRAFVPAWVDIPISSWLPNSASAASEWITPSSGAGTALAGWYVYRTTLLVPSILPGGGVPTGVTINGHLASDNALYAIFLGSPGNSASCSLVSGQSFPVNPAGGADFQQWWDFSFTNSLPLTLASPRTCIL